MIIWRVTTWLYNESSHKGTFSGVALARHDFWREFEQLTDRYAGEDVIVVLDPHTDSIQVSMGAEAVSLSREYVQGSTGDRSITRFNARALRELRDNVFGYLTQTGWIEVPVETRMDPANSLWGSWTFRKTK